MDRFTEITRECFDAAIHLRRSDAASLPAAAQLRERLRSIVDRIFARASQAGLGREEATDVAYAAVALLDEIVMSRSDALRDAWAGQSLQLHYFHENVAGEMFFTRLQTLRGDPRRRDILRVYYVALQLGFEGRYRIRGGDLDLYRIVEELKVELERGREHDELLSPNGERPDGDRRAQGRARWLPWAAAAAIAALGAAGYVGLQVSLASSSDEVVQKMQQAAVH